VLFAQILPADEVPEASCGVIGKRHDQLLPFTPSHAEGPVTGYGPGACTRRPIVPGCRDIWP
jgi:hypothetical protein